ncbi:MAG: TonB-dependent receptor plug domain-containing protein [Paramuribaculum sp.]|nr:TonB-dependent receptor plug domain-containing protein [Paramuribaculum sp.]
MVFYIVAFCALLPYPATAQGSIDGDSVVQSRTISTVTISGKRNRAATSTAPLYNIGVNQINRFSITDIGNAVRRLPGVNLRDYGGAGGLKTVSVRGLGAAHTSVALSGNGTGKY